MMESLPTTSKRSTTDDRDEETEQKRKRMCCIFNCKYKSIPLNSPKDHQSWLDLVRAADIRKYHPIVSIAAQTPEGTVPQVFYHRECRNSFTHKRELDSLLNAGHSLSEPPRDRPNRRQDSLVVSPDSRVYNPVCIFCMRETKYIKGNQKDKLVKCVDLRADDTVRRTAVRKNDSRLIAVVSREIVAAEVHYHRTCYRDYTRPTIQELKSDKVCTNTAEAAKEECEETLYSRAETASYNELFNQVRSDLFENPKVVRLTELSTTLTHNLANLGVTEVKPSTRKHLQRKLVSEFGESLHFTSDDKGKILVYPDNLSMSAIVKENAKLTDELQKLKRSQSSVQEEILKNASRVLRNEVKELKCNTQWPPLPAQLTDPSAFVPNSLTIFLIGLFSGQFQAANISRRVERLVKSVGQDIVYGISRGAIKPPKQILLPQAVKTLTGNVEVVKILNRYGHGISYTQMEELETALALQKLGQGAEYAVPEDIHPHIMTTLAWDNIDRLEETLSGGGTSHRVNGIAVQPKTYGPHIHQKEQVTIGQKDSTKQRSISFTQPLLPIYNAGERNGPPARGYVMVRGSEMKSEVYRKTLIWLLARMLCSENQCVSSWTGFNINVRNDVQIVEDVVTYLPTINAPATQLSTVNEVLEKSQEVKEALSLKSIVVVFDQALYAKATEIIWKHQEKFSDVVPRMGVFHTICTLLSIIGKRFGDGGLKDLCIESGVISEGSVNGVLDGHKYNRAVRFHKLLYEAFLRLAWEGFLLQGESDSEIQVVVDVIRKFTCDVRQATFMDVLGDRSYVSVANKFNQYLEHLRSDRGDLASFWMSYVDLVDVMLNLLRASREGNWAMHLRAIHDMIPWCFAYDRQNYARYLSCYYAEMSNLETEHPEIYEFLNNGGFSVQLGKENSFGRIPVDQAIEETVNKDTQTAGGTKGFSLKPGAVSRYYLTAEYRSSFLHLLRDAVGTNQFSSFYHPDLSKSRIKKDERDVQSLMEMLERNWINPFSTRSDIMVISTGIVAPQNVVNDLLKANDQGTKAYKNFRDERLERDPPKIKFHERLVKQKLKTFSDLKVKKSYHVGGKQIIVRADRDLFAKMILIAQTRTMDMKEVLAHRLGPIPWSLANPEGTLRKTAKSSLPKELKKNLTPVDSIPEKSACIIDGMALVQRLEASNMSFGDVSGILLKMVLREGSNCTRIDVVFDVYREQSIKNAERVQRGSASATIYNAIAPGHKIKQWRKFLGSSENKTKLVEFLVGDWTKKHLEELTNKELFVTCGETCKRLSMKAVMNITDLDSSQEEADTRILLHANHCAKAGYKAVIIVSEDTDVFVLCVAFSSRILCPMYIKSGTKTRIQYTDVQKIANVLGNTKSDALLGLHAFTGCDTVSAFAGKGKMSALKLVKKDERHAETMRMLGTCWETSDALINRLEAFTCQIYSSGTKTEKVNELRFNLFCARKGEAGSWQLPPCSSSLKNHIKRANYQCKVWRLSLEACPHIPSPVNHGWRYENGELTIDWSSALPAPEAVLQLLACTCARRCVEATCTCLQHKLRCTYLCKLTTCSNQKPEDEDEEEYQGDDDKDYNSDDEVNDDDLWDESDNDNE